MNFVIFLIVIAIMFLVGVEVARSTGRPGVIDLMVGVVIGVLITFGYHLMVGLPVL